MPLGDSLTDGFSIPGGYRIELWNRAVADGRDIDFEGTLSNGSDLLPDHDHEGHTGYRIDQIASGIGTWLPLVHSEVILLMIGANDMLQNYQVNTAPSRLQSLIDQIASLEPKSKIFVASVPPESDPTVNQRISTFNQSIPGIVQTEAQQGKLVYYVNIHDAVSLSDLTDGIHFNQHGYDVMGDTWYAALVAQNALPIQAWTYQDVGSVNVRGQGTVNVSTGQIAIQASGSDIWYGADSFGIMYQRLHGDGQIVARVDGIQNTDTWAKAGVMIRGDLTESSPHAVMLVSGGAGTSFQRRTTLGGSTAATTGPRATAPFWVKLSRTSNSISAFTSPDGINWSLVGIDTVTLPEDVYVGLAVTSHNNSMLNSSFFSQITVGSVQTSAADLNFYLTDMTPTQSTNGWGPIEYDQSNGEMATDDGHLQSIRGQTFARGLGVHAASDVTYALGKHYNVFAATIGIDDETGGKGSVIFQVKGDGVLLYQSAILTGTSAAIPISVNVQGVSTLDLVVTDAGDGNAYDHADWGGARLMANTTYLSDLAWVSTTNGWGPVERDLSNGETAAGDGHVITIAGVTYAKGLGVHANSQVVYNLAGAYQSFDSYVGVDDETGGHGSVTFQVIGDGKTLYSQTGVLGGHPASQIHLSVAGINQLTLIVTDNGDGNSWDHADWAGARVSK